MAFQTDSMDHLLATLGEARQNGAFAGAAAGYPWEARTAVKAQSLTEARHSRLWKVGPLAAAAAVAVLFVMPKWGSQDGSPIMTDNVRVTDSTERPETLAPSATGPEKLDCDFDGDGVVNGLEIQHLIEKIRSGEATIGQADELARCLLNG